MQKNLYCELLIFVIRNFFIQMKCFLEEVVFVFPTLITIHSPWGIAGFV